MSDTATYRAAAADPERALPRQRSLKTLDPSMLLAAAGLLLVWEIAARLLNNAFLPPASVVLVNFTQLLLNGALTKHFLASIYRVLAGILIAVLFAAPLGLLLGQDKRVDKFMAPIIYLTYPVPKIVLLPVVILFLGIGDTSKIFMIGLILFFQVLVVVRDASVGVRGEMINSVRSLGARRRHLFRYVYLPACLPAILTALRVSAGTAIAVLFLTETYATNVGLGYFIMTEGLQRISFVDMYAGIVGMSLLGFVLYVVLDQLEKRLCRWIYVTK